MKGLEGAIYILCLISIVIGAVFMLLALKYRTEKCPRFPVFNPKRYTTWKEWYTEKGHRYNWIGSSMVFLGGALGLVARLIMFPHS